MAGRCLGDEGQGEDAGGGDPTTPPGDPDLSEDDISCSTAEAEGNDRGGMTAEPLCGSGELVGIKPGWGNRGW